MNSKHLATRLAALLLGVVFLVPGLLLIPYLGIQEDEAIFAIGLFLPDMAVGRFTIWPTHVVAPSMLMSYVGALKSWIYAPLLHLFKPSVYLLRIPVLLMGAATIYLFYEFVRRTCGPRPAFIAAALLATDTTYLLMTCFDWGPAAMQHLLLVSGALLFWRFVDEGRGGYLYASSFLFGLAVWDKAVFIWMLGGLGIGVAAVYTKPLLRKLRPTIVVCAAGAFMVGALPFALYNARNHWEAFQRPWVALKELPARVEILQSTLDGSALLGTLVRVEDAPSRMTPTRVESLARFIDTKASGLSRNPMAWLLAASLALLPFQGSRVAVAGLLSLILAYAFMLISNGGGAAHHVVLLWPLPHFVIVAVWSRTLSRAPRGLVAAVVGSICLLNILTTNHYLARASLGGSGLLWTDASRRLPEALGNTAGQTILATDWGIMGPLVTLSKSRFPIYAISDLLTAESLTTAQQALLADAIAASSSLFVGHAEGSEVFAGVNSKLQTFAQQRGYRKALIRSVCDRHGRPIFEVFRFYLPSGLSVGGQAGSLRPIANRPACDEAKSCERQRQATSLPHFMGGDLSSQKVSATHVNKPRPIERALPFFLTPDRLLGGAQRSGRGHAAAEQAVVEHLHEVCGGCVIDGPKRRHHSGGARRQERSRQTHDAFAIQAFAQCRLAGAQHDQLRMKPELHHVVQPHEPVGGVATGIVEREHDPR
jgi:4-amino-4-deoxy-L-arabinose transferase-like glycosyltransferase